MDERELVAFCRLHHVHPLSLKLLYEFSQTPEGIRFVNGASLGLMPDTRRNAVRQRRYDRAIVDDLY